MGPRSPARFPSRAGFKLSHPRFLTTLPHQPLKANHHTSGVKTQRRTTRTTLECSGLAMVSSALKSEWNNYANSRLNITLEATQDSCEIGNQALFQLVDFYITQVLFGFLTIQVKTSASNKFKWQEYTVNKTRKVKPIFPPFSCHWQNKTPSIIFASREKSLFLATLKGFANKSVFLKCLISGWWSSPWLKQAAQLNSI